MTVERQALNALLALFPDFDLLAVDWQLPDRALLHAPEYRSDEAGPWLLVTLGQRSDDGAYAWARHTYAIWKHTGAVHGMDQYDGVIDPPLIPGRPR